VYIVDDHKRLIGVADLREIILAQDATLLGDLMTSPIVSAEKDDRREDLAELFARYQFHMIPVLDEQDGLLGVVHSRDIMKGLVARPKG
jgi:magnesium transporter